MLVLALVVTCGFSAMAITYEHEKMTFVDNGFWQYGINPDDSFNLSFDINGPSLLASANVGLLKGGITKADVAFAGVTAQFATKEVHCIARNGTGSYENAQEDFDYISAYVESSGTLWIAINNLWYHDCATKTNNNNYTYVWH